MQSPLAVLVLAAPAAFALVAMAAVRTPGRRPAHLERLDQVAAWFGVVVASAAGLAVATRGLIESPTLGIGGVGLSIRLDSLSTIMLLMIALLAVVIFRYSATYLDGDPRQGVFLGRLAATIAAVEVLVLSGNVALLVLAWIATSLALHELLVFYPDRRRAVTAAHKKFIVARVGDVFLIAAAVLLVRWAGSGNLEVIFTKARTGLDAGWGINALTMAALFLAIAATLKSAQFPTHGWLVEVMETPTPVSALLHAGILNAGPFLAIRMGWVLDGTHLANATLIVAGGLTALFASVVLLTQPSVKVALAYSSAAHMGFMLMVCAMGVYPAALLHLVAHSFYKAHAFLSSGSVVDEARAAKVATPKRLGSAVRIVGSLAIAGGIYLALALAIGVDLADQPVLVVIGAVLVMGTTQIIAPALDSTGRGIAVVRTAILALGVTAAFFTLEAGAHHLLSDYAPDSLERTGIHFLLFGAVLVAFASVVVLQILEPSRAPSARRRAIAMHLRNGLYANALFDRVVGSLRLPEVAR